MTSGSRLSLFLPQGVSLLELGKPVRADTLASWLQIEIQKSVAVITTNEVQGTGWLSCDGGGSLSAES